MSIVKDFNFLLRGVIRCHRFARELASSASERHSTDQRGESYGHKDPSRALLALEKALSTCMCKLTWLCVLP